MEFKLNFNILISGLAVVFATGVAIIAMNKKKRNYVNVTKIAKILIYPIKSLPGIEVNSAVVTKTGLKYGKLLDRSWLLINEDNRFVTQRQESTLALLKVQFNGDELLVDGPNMPTLKLKIIEKLESHDLVIETSVWQQPVEGVDCGREAKEWFSKYLGRDGIRLIQYVPGMILRKGESLVNGSRRFEKKFPITYQDGSGILVINNDSVDDLNSRIETDDKVSYRNFRPNILIEDYPPYEEDKWEYANIGKVHFLNLKPCDRCVLTTVNPDTGVRTDKEPLITLRKYRLAPENLRNIYGTSPFFGINLGAECDGQINVGDEIRAVLKE